MDGILYPISLIFIVLLAFALYRSENNFLAITILLIGAYMIYSHETGKTVTDWKNDMVKSIDESAENFSESRGTQGYDGKKVKEYLDKEGE